MLAGAIFGEILRRFHLVSYACGARHPRWRSSRAPCSGRGRAASALRLGLAVLMLGGDAVLAAWSSSGRIERVQQEIGAGVAPSSLPAGDPRRVEFGRLHGQSTLIQLVPLIGGLVLMLFESRD